MATPSMNRVHATLAMAMLLHSVASLCGEDETCNTGAAAAVPKSSNVLLQTSSEGMQQDGRDYMMRTSLLESRSMQSSSMRSSPLKEKVGALEADMKIVKEKVQHLETEVGLTGGRPGPVASAAASAAQSQSSGPRGAQQSDSQNVEQDLASLARMDSQLPSMLSLAELEGAESDRDSDSNDNYPGVAPASFVRNYQGAAALSGTIKGRVATLEGDVTDMRSRIDSLENEIKGRRAMNPSFVQAKSESRSSGLKGRINFMEDVVDDLKTRVLGLEHYVMG